MNSDAYNLLYFIFTLSWPVQSVLLDFVFFLSVHWSCLANLSAAVLISGDSGPEGEAAASVRLTGSEFSSELLRLWDDSEFLLASCTERGRSITRSGVCFNRNSRKSWDLQKSFGVVIANKLHCEVALFCQSSRFAMNVVCVSGEVERLVEVCCSTVSSTLDESHDCFFEGIELHFG